MGRGPGRIHAEFARRDGERATADAEYVEAPGGFLNEIGTTFELARRLAERVRSAVSDGRFPVVLSGNCFAAVGVLAGLAPSRPAVVWLDCHGDFHTPESTASGFLDGMSLAILAGRCWSKLATTIPGFAATDGRNTIHLGGRDFDPGEREAMEGEGIRLFGAESISTAEGVKVLEPVLRSLGRSCDGAYLHLDLDALDPREAPANGYQKPGGFTVGQVLDVLELVRAHLPLRAAALTAYDPTCDAEGRTADAASRFIRHVLSSPG